MHQRVGSVLFAAALSFLAACGGGAKNQHGGVPTSGPSTGEVTGGETLVHRTARITIELPAGWTSEKDGDSLTVSDPSGEVVVAFIVIPVGAVKEAANALGENLGKRVDDLKFGDGEEIEINGMQGKFIEGDGNVKGTSVDILVALVDTPSNENDLM
ncbi:MAG: hypothetical protein ABI175_28190, partial [Polyangiales bacterium]